jgi:sugar lactone lactonase YvrE
VSVGDLLLGFADVETANSAGELHDINTNEYIPLVNGRTLPVKFLIQQGLGATRGIYVSNNGSNSVTLYPLGAGGNIAPLATVAGGNTGLSRPRGIAFDEPGNLYVANSTGGDGTGSITEYAAGSTGDVAPTVTIAGSNTGLADPRGLAFDASGRLFAANASILTVSSYAAGGAGKADPISTLITPEGTFGVAFDGAGRLYLTTAGLPGVAVYAAGANGNAAPIATIAGANTGLSQPRGIAFDGSGRLYVVDQGNRAAVFAAGATGNVSPVALIAGPSTGLNSPFGVIVDALGRVYVTNEVGNSVTVYASGASGDATPVTTIAGSNTGLDGPLFIGIF